MHDTLDATRRSWNAATANHNRHKGDQAAALRRGEDPLFPEELNLLGPLDGLSLVHLQCNAGQDSLGLARRGATVTGVDFSDVAIDFAQKLSADSGIAARFERREILEWMQSTEDRFDVAFASYGALGWIRDLSAWMRGARRVLRPGGRLVVVEFHPLCPSFDAGFALKGDDYFQFGPYTEPVSDYVAESAFGEQPVPLSNPHDAVSWQHGVADIVCAVLDAGFDLETLREYPHSNFCRIVPGLVEGPDRTWVFPEGVAKVPLMLGFSATRR